MDRPTPPLPPLSPRLAAVASAIAPGARVADVGTDHGKLPLWLLASGVASFCVATERTGALLCRVARPEETAPWVGRLAYRHGDGLQAIAASDRIDTIVLAGLGGRTIVRLLDTPNAATASLSRLVLQPRSETSSVRAWLSAHDWRPESESLAFERGRFHLTLAADRGVDADLYRHPSLSREDLLAAGPLLARSGQPEVTRFWQRERDRLASILARKGRGPSIARARAGLLRAERILAAISTPGG
jgi:tRNA (adenine22-N1)-methyltransferase